MILDETLPKFGNQKEVRRIFGLSRTWLDAMVVRGEIRSIKNGESKQAMRLYCVADIVEALDRMSVGKKPRCPGGISNNRKRGGYEIN